jgi:putative DNA primase/helicase
MYDVSSLAFSDLPLPAAEARRAVGLHLSVVPLKPRSKIPSVPHGIDDAITTRMGVRARAETHPNDNYGIVLDDKIFVVDIDSADGWAALKALERQYGELPATVETITARGSHLLFRARPGEPVPSSTGKLGDGIDVKGDRSHAVLAGSMHPDGTRYRYAPGRALGEIKIAKAPGWLLKAVREPRRRDDQVPRRIDAAARVRGDGRMTRYGKTALNSELDRLRQTEEGERNTTLNKAAFVLAGLCTAGALDEATVRASLTETAREIGLEKDEIRKTLDSAMGAGMRAPRDLAHLATSTGKPPVPEAAIYDPLAEELAALGETDADNAARFARRHRETVAYVQDRGILTYEDGVWRPGGDTLALRLAEETARAIAGEVAYLNESTDKSRREVWARHSLSKPALERMIGLAKGRLEVPGEAFDAHPWLLRAPNRTVGSG